MNPFKEMDLYKGVILASVLLLPAAGWWIQKNRQGIEAANRAVVEATRSHGVLERIAELQRQIDIVESNRVNASDATEQHSLYFQRQIYSSDKNRTLEKDDFSIGAVRPEAAYTGNSRQRATDHVVEIQFAKRENKDKLLPREFLFAVLFNCESGARVGGAAPSIWKLRSLSIQNASVKDLAGTSSKTPPAEFEDQWIVKDLKFARREPEKERK
jgi:tellurite resistance protein